MKISIKILSVVLLIAFYSFSLGVINAPANITGNFNKQESDSISFFSTLSTNLFCYTFQKDSSAEGNNSERINIFNYTFNAPQEKIKKINQLTDSEFNQYSRFSGNLLIQLSKATIIFPFNYFW